MLRVSGTIRHADSEDLRAAIDRAIKTGRDAPLIVDLAGLDFICSAGMRILVQSQRRLDEDDRRMVTTGLTGAVRETIEMSGIGGLITTAPSVESALADLMAR